MSNALKKEIQKGFLIIFQFISDLFVKHVLFIQTLKDQSIYKTVLQMTQNLA